MSVANIKNSIMKGGKMVIMPKKLLSIILAALLLAMPISQAFAVDTTTENIKFALTKFKGMTSTLRQDYPDLLPQLVDIIESIDDNNTVLKNVYNTIKDTSLGERLNRIGINQQNLEDAMKIFRGENKEGYTKVKEYVEDINNTDKETEFVTWLENKFNEIVKNDGAPLKTLDDYVVQKFQGWYNFLNFVYDNQDIFKNNVTVEYSKDNGTLTISSSKADYIASEINNLLSENNYNIAPFTAQDVTAVISAQNTFLSAVTGDNALKFAQAFKSLGYNVTGLETSGGTSSGGGGGGGGTTTTEKPAIKEPTASGEPMQVNVPSDAVKVTEQDGKSVVTLDEDTVSDLLKLLDQAAAKAEGKALAITFDLTGSKVKDDVSLTLPANLVAKALDKGAAVVVKTRILSLEVPASAVGAQGEMKINVSALAASDAVKGITGLDNMKTIGKAAEISMTVGDKAAQLKGRLTLRFGIKGLAANIDKLGIYYVNEDAGKLEFVGGKVDKNNAEIIAVVPHLSKYVLAEYSKTFADIRTHWAKNYIESMAAKHVIDGRSEDVFAPEDKVTRAEFAKIIVQTLGLDIKKYTGTFEDVNSTAWYADYVQTAYDNKLIQGKVAGRMFDPNGKITRQEMMTIIGRALSASQPQSTSSLASYKDAGKVADYAKPYVSYLIGKGLVSGYPDGTIKPQNNTTRAEAVKLIYSIYNQ